MIRRLGRACIKVESSSGSGSAAARRRARAARGMMSSLFCLATRFLSTILFFAAAVGLFSWRYTQKSELDERPSSVGLVTRGYFVNCWCVALLARGCSSGAQLFGCSGVGCRVTYWDCRLLRGLADAPFCSTYGLFVLFVGHVSSTASGRTFPRLVPLFGILNGAFYAALIALAAKCLASREHADVYGDLAFDAIGCAYLGLLGLLAYFARDLRKTLTGDGAFLVPGELLQLARAMIGLLGLVFVCQAVHYFSWTSRGAEAWLTGPRGHTTCHGICATDLALDVGLELLPSVAGFALLRRGGDRRRGAPAPSPFASRYSSIV